MTRDGGESRSRRNCGGGLAVDGRQGSVHGRSTRVNSSASRRPGQEAAKADPGRLNREGAGEHEYDGGVCTRGGEAVRADKKSWRGPLDTRRALRAGEHTLISQLGPGPRDYKSIMSDAHLG